MSVMSDRQAYTAMYQFLKEIYLRTSSEELGSMLGGMSILNDGTPADPAVANDWRQAVEYALSGGEADSLELK